MLRRIIFPLLFGLAGTCVLVYLGTWQLQRLDWKETVLAEIDARIGDEPVALPISPQEATDRFLPVAVEGRFLEGDLPVLASTREVGAMFRIIAPFETVEGRVILVDRGFVLDELKDKPRPAGEARLIGNLHWPDDKNSSTPEPDLAANVWFARDISEMANRLNAEPVLLVVRETSESGTGITPLPVDSSGIPNDHFEYAVTWYGLALVWVFMTGFLIYRLTRKHEG